MYVYVYVHLKVCFCVCKYLHICLLLYISLRMYTCECLHLYIFMMYIWIYTDTCISNTYARVYIHIYMTEYSRIQNMYLCIHMYVLIFPYQYPHRYSHMHSLYKLKITCFNVCKYNLTNPVNITQRHRRRWICMVWSTYEEAEVNECSLQHTWVWICILYKRKHDRVTSPPARCGNNSTGHTRMRTLFPAFSFSLYTHIHTHSHIQTAHTWMYIRILIFV